MKNKILKAIKEITHEISLMSDEEFLRVLEENKDGDYTKIIQVALNWNKGDRIL